MHGITRLTRTTSLLALAATAAAIAAGSASAASDVVGHLYVNDNTAGTNTISAFDRQSVVDYMTTGVSSREVVAASAARGGTGDEAD